MGQLHQLGCCGASTGRAGIVRPVRVLGASGIESILGCRVPHVLRAAFCTALAKGWLLDMYSCLQASAVAADMNFWSCTARPHETVAGSRSVGRLRSPQWSCRDP